MLQELKMKYAVSLRTDKCFDPDLPFIGLENIESGTGKYLPGQASQEIQSQTNHFYPGDVLYGKLRPYLRKSLVTEFEGRCSSEILVLKGQTINRKLLSYLLLSHEFTEYVTSATYGTKMPRANWVDIGSYRLPMCSFDQDHAVAYLDRKTAQIDRLIADKEALIALLKEQRQAMISEAVTRGLDPSVPTKDSGLEWLGHIPAHWGTSKSQWLFSLRKDRAFPDDEQLTASQQYGIVYQKDYMEQGARVVQVITGADILKHVEPNDFVMSMRSFQGGIEWSNLRGKISSAYVMLIPQEDLVFPPYFKWLLKSHTYIRALQSTSNLVRDGQALRYNNFKQVDLPLIPLEEQRAIADNLLEKTTAIDMLMQDTARQRSLLMEYRQSVISEAVTGTYVVPPEHDMIPMGDGDATKGGARDGDGHNRESL